MKKYINAKDLPNFKESLEYLFESEYCVQNYDEEGNKTTADLYKDGAEIAAAYIRSHSQDESFIKEICNLIFFFEENEIDFVRLY